MVGINKCIRKFIISLKSSQKGSFLMYGSFRALLVFVLKYAKSLSWYQICFIDIRSFLWRVLCL
ncbi:hypothetical protein CPI40_01710 [Moraxella catarrhalis]|nr:hypothetical protein [Moraxella catarrhalis]MPX29909.1 hypothetical protein [Moraxella catarrhalis]RKM20936.1 hypothetical protein D6D69_07720 [Moraxella catarrhalis]RKM36873.1 hypothetical protein D6D62_00585 [Moraxella catarrhalis]